jgi:hypothetical protein
MVLVRRLRAILEGVTPRAANAAGDEDMHDFGMKGR